MADCGCACHGAYQAPCDIEGGCGSTGCDYGDSGHRCARGEHCQDREPVRDDDGRHTGSWLPRRITVERGLCETCTRTVQYALGHLAGDVVELTMLMLRRANTAMGTLVASTPELRVPIDLGIDALRAEIDSEAVNWAEPTAEALGVDWDTSSMGHTRIAVRVKRAATLLANAVPTLLALPEQEHSAWQNGEPREDPAEPGVQDTVVRDGVDGALALLDLHRRAWSMAGRTEFVQRIIPPCRHCGLRALVRHDGDDFVVCENCREITPWDLIPFMCRVLIDCERALQEERQRQEAAA